MLLTSIKYKKKYFFIAIKNQTFVIRMCANQLGYTSCIKWKFKTSNDVDVIIIIIIVVARPKRYDIPTARHLQHSNVFSGYRPDEMEYTYCMYRTHILIFENVYIS